MTIIATLLSDVLPGVVPLPSGGWPQDQPWLRPKCTTIHRNWHRCRKKNH